MALARVGQSVLDSGKQILGGTCPKGQCQKKSISTPVWLSFDQSTWNFTGGYIISRHNWGLILGSVGCKIFANLLKLEVLKYIIMHSSHQLLNARSFNRRYNAIVAWKPSFMALPWNAMFLALSCFWTILRSTPADSMILPPSIGRCAYSVYLTNDTMSV